MNKLRKALLVILFISYIFKWTYLFLIGRNQNETQNAVINVNVPDSADNYLLCKNNKFYVVVCHFFISFSLSSCGERVQKKFI